MRDPHGLLSLVLSILMILVGLILLLPGICAGFFVLASFQSPGNPASSGLAELWIICFAVSAGGILLVVWAARRLVR